MKALQIALWVFIAAWSLTLSPQEVSVLIMLCIAFSFGRMTGKVQ